jgi:hypothetical protein
MLRVQTFNHKNLEVKAKCLGSLCKFQKGKGIKKPMQVKSKCMDILELVPNQTEPHLFLNFKDALRMGDAKICNEFKELKFN